MDVRMKSFMNIPCVKKENKEEYLSIFNYFICLYFPSAFYRAWCGRHSKCFCC